MSLFITLVDLTNSEYNHTIRFTNQKMKWSGLLKRPVTFLKISDL